MKHKIRVFNAFGKRLFSFSASFATRLSSISPKQKVRKCRLHTAIQWQCNGERVFSRATRKNASSSLDKRHSARILRIINDETREKCFFLHKCFQLSHTPSDKPRRATALHSVPRLGSDLSEFYANGKRVSTSSRRHFHDEKVISQRFGVCEII